MLNFNFRLERILNYKETMEEFKKAEYGNMKKKLNYEEDKLYTYYQQKGNIKNEKNSTVSRVKAGNLAMYNNYINVLNNRIKVQQEIVSNTKTKVEEVKEEMVEAVQEKKIFEKLKEKEYEKHLYQVNKLEEKQVDTIVNYKTVTQK